MIKRNINIDSYSLKKSNFNSLNQCQLNTISRECLIPSIN